MYHNVHCSTITIARTWKQPKCPSTDEWIRCGNIYNEILLSHKKKQIELLVVRWMDLEPVIQSEVIREKQILYTNTYIWNLKKKTEKQKRF